MGIVLLGVDFIDKKWRIESQVRVGKSHFPHCLKQADRRQARLMQPDPWGSSSEAFPEGPCVLVRATGHSAGHRVRAEGHAC